MRYVYAIFDNNDVYIWDTQNPIEGDIPFFYQPNHPSGRAWESREDAESWVQQHIADIEASEAPSE